MLLGNSQYANDQIRIFPSSSVKDEAVTLEGTTSVNLAWNGVVVGSIEVWNTAKTVQYTEAIDFDVTYGTISTPTSIVRIPGGAISDPEDVLVSYSTKLPIQPLNQKEVITGEEVVLEGTVETDLLNYGVLEGTIDVKNDVGSSYIAGKDYVIQLGDSETKTTIRRSGASSAIPDGGTVYVDYESGENITVTYVTNGLISRVESALDGTTDEGSSHATNNVVVKEAFEILVDIVSNVLSRGDLNLEPQEIKDNAATEVSKEFSAKLLGDGAGQSDIISAIDGAQGIDRVRVPLAKMVRQDGSIVVRQEILSKFISSTAGLVATWVSDEDISENIILNATNPVDLSYWDPQEGTIVVTNSAGTVTYVEQIDYVIVYNGREAASQIYRLSSGSIGDGDTVVVEYTTGTALRFNTQDNGGAKVQIGTGEGYWYHPVAVFEDDVHQLETQLTEADVSQGAGRAFIRSDRKVVLSTRTGDDPSNHTYSVTYLTFNETGAKDLDATGLEYLRLGSLQTNIVN